MEVGSKYNATQWSWLPFFFLNAVLLLTPLTFVSKLDPKYWKMLEPGEFYFQRTEPLWFHIKAEVRLDRTSNVDPQGYGIDIDIGALIGSIAAAATVMGSCGPGVASQLTADGSVDLHKHTAMLMAKVFVSIGIRAGHNLWVIGGSGSVSAENAEGDTVFVQELDNGNLYENIHQRTMVTVEEKFFAGPVIYTNKPVIMTITGGPEVEGYWDPDTDQCYQTIDPKDLEINIPCMPDADHCTPELSCHECCNPSEYWLGPLVFQCGTEPCWADNTVRTGANHLGFKFCAAGNSIPLVAALLFPVAMCPRWHLPTVL